MFSSNSSLSPSSSLSLIKMPGLLEIFTVPISFSSFSFETAFSSSASSNLTLECGKSDLDGPGISLTKTIRLGTLSG